MNDLAFLAIIVVFFAVATLFVRACDHLIGSGDDAAGHADEPVTDSQVAA
jgi:hypothetical protein